jgi:hypothetical protein
MSSPTDRDYQPGDPSPYAPRWVRNAPQQRPASVRPPLAADASEADETNPLPREDVIGSEQSPPLVTAAPVSHDEGFMVNEFRVPRSLDPGIVPDPWAERGVRLRRYRVLGMLGRLALAGSAAAIVAVLAVGKFSVPGSTGATEQAGTQPSFGVRFSAPDTKPQQPPIVAEGASDLPQQVALADPSTPVATPRPSVAVAPPAPAAPAPTPAAALPSPASAPTAALPPTAPEPAASAPPPELSPAELAALLKRGQQLAASGDMAAARLTLRRAAEARDAQAALALGATYDPVVLRSLGIFGVTPDVALARSWYEKARAYGSAEAPRRLELLAKSK